MSLNWKEIDLILNELDMEGSQVQKIRQPDYRTLVIDLYKPENRFSLLISLNQGKVRLHRLTRKLPGKIPLQRFAQLLRSRIGGGRIIRAEQIGDDRIVLIKVEKTGETTNLYLASGEAALTSSRDKTGTIIDAFYRRPAKGEVSGKPTGLRHEKKEDRGGNSNEDSFRIRALHKAPLKFDHWKNPLHSEEEPRPGQGGLKERGPEHPFRPGGNKIPNNKRPR